MSPCAAPGVAVNVTTELSLSLAKLLELHHVSDYSMKDVNLCYHCHLKIYRKKIGKNVKCDYNLITHQHRNIIQTKSAKAKYFFIPKDKGVRKVQ